MAGNHNDNSPICFEQTHVIRDKKFNHELAIFLDSLGLSGDCTVEWIVDEIYLLLTSPVLDRDGILIDFDTVEIENMFGVDARRYVNGYKRWSRQMPRQRLQKRCVDRITWIDVARKSFLSRQGFLNK